MKKLSFLLLAGVLMIMLPSCATILAGSKSPVRVKGEPPKAEVYFNGSYVGKAPVTVRVPRGRKVDRKITIKANGYNPAEVTLSSRLSIGYLGLDILSGAILPLGIDFITGSIYAPYPKHVKYNLEPKGNLLSKYKVGEKVLIQDKNKSYKGTVTEVTPKGVKVKYVRPATMLEKKTKKVDQITENKFFYFNEVKPISNKSQN